MMKKVYLVLLWTCLACAISLQFWDYFWREEKETARKNELSSFSVSMDSWQVEDIELSDFIRTKDFLAQKLGFDEHLYKSFTKGSKKLTLYCAHWKRGNKALSLVQEHSPRKCWVAAGWSMTENEEILEISKFFPKEKPIYNKFTKEQESAHILSWHSLEDSSKSNFKSSSTQLGAIASTLKNGTSQRQAQLQITLVSNTPYEVLVQDSDFLELLKSVDALLE